MGKQLKGHTMRKLFLFILFGCIAACTPKASLSLTEFTVKEGKHDFTPNFFHFRFKDYSVVYACKFTNDSKYLIEGPDQYDWLKGAGYSNELVTNTKNSAMWAWRFNPVTDLFEVTGYFNKDWKSFYSENTFNRKMLKVKTEELFFVELKKDRKHDYYELKIYTDPHGEVLVYRLQYNKLKFADRNIGSWFGGTSPAPKIVKIYWIMNPNEGNYK